MQAAIHTRDSVVRNWRICFILASAFCFSGLATAEDPPRNLKHLIAARESAAAEAQSNYTYRQTVTLDELNKNGLAEGTYREIRDIIFSPTQQRSEQVVGKPYLTLTNLKLTDEDFRDMREIQPFLLTKDQAFLYQTHFRGEESMDGVDCWVVQIEPRQILDGQRLFDGMLWVSKKDYSVIRSEGEAVPQIRTLKAENLFPHFTTIRQKVDGDFWFPVLTYGDDTLDFRGGGQRVRLTIKYENYRRFGADSKITYSK
ncbi:MAG TPA: hypothetical protein VME17_17245 [Bryobacteraceae bacterium]|nr:hypothetical protein [Bryobacteraceae bacterium]